MGASPVPERLSWIVGLLDPAPDARLLELGCGRGVAVDLVCRRLEGPVEAAGSVGGAYDVVLAMNVNVFWTRPDPAPELDRLHHVLAPGGSLHLGWEVTRPDRALEVATRVTDALGRHGFDADTVPSPSNPSLVCVVGQPR